MDVQLSEQHDQVIEALSEMRAQFAGLSHSGRLIVEMAIMMLEYLDEHLISRPIDGLLCASREELDELRAQVAAARRPSSISWTVDDFDELIWLVRI